MKAKEVTKKLVLNKTTISDLTDADLNAVKGGATTTRGGAACPTIDGKTCW